MNKNKRLLLVTTALEGTWGKSQDILFLGEWCKKFSRRHVWGKRNSITQTADWSDRAKLANDYEYISELYERILAWLVIEMNRLHEVNHTSRYWRIVIGPWVLTYIPVIWNRWEEIRRVLSENDNISTFIPDMKYVRPPAFNYQNSMNLMVDDKWNYLLFIEILKRMKSDRISFYQIPIEVNIRTTTPAKNKIIKYNISTIIDGLLDKLNYKNSYKVVLHASYFPIYELIRLMFSIGSIPRLFMKFNVPIQSSKFDSKLRSTIRSDIKFKSPFETFLIDIIGKDLPIVHVEGYRDLIGKIKQLPKTQIIMTAVSHFTNEVFKVWSAKRVEDGATLIISSHGGSLTSKYCDLNHVNIISDIKVVWSRPYLKNHIQLPPQKIIGKLKTNRKKITLIGLEFPRYTERIKSGPDGPLMLEEFEQKKEFIDNLSDRTRSDFVVRPPYPERGDGGWETSDRYKDLYGDDIISINTSAKLIDDYQSSRLIICSYPQTTFSEAMHSEIPTILLYLDECWELQPLFDDLIKKLKSEKIIFSSSYEAAIHVNSIQEDPYIWWNQESVIEAREMFFDVCGWNAGKDKITEWSNFLKKTLKNRKLN